MARPEKQVDPVKVAQVIGTLGGTDADLAAALGISRQALTKRKSKNAELVVTLKKAKEEADARVEKSLYERAVGYVAHDCHVSQFEGRITVTPLEKHYPPDVLACIFWLKNRKPEQWREKTESKPESEIAGLTTQQIEELRALARWSAAEPRN